MRIVTPKQIVENEFNLLIALVNNLLIKDKNRDYYIRIGMTLREHMIHTEDHATYIKERLEGSKQLCMDMAHEA